MADEQFTIEVKRFEAKDPRLGRHVVHDSRSLRYRVRAAPLSSLKSIRHIVNIPILDQGNIGSCTGHAATAALASAKYWAAGYTVLKQNAQADHLYAEGVYGDATRLDPWTGEWLPDDTGSDGLSVAKVLKARGLISGYQHATSLEATLTALADTVVMIGSTWMSSMYDANANGQIFATGYPEGGHEYVLDELDVERQRVWVRNSWSEQWGVNGRAWMTWEALRALLADDGDCTVLVARNEPAPVPTPVPTEVKVSPQEAALIRELHRFTDNKACPQYLKYAAQHWEESLDK